MVEVQKKQALRLKSRQLEKSKKNSDRLSKAKELDGVVKEEIKEENVYLSKIFPLFLIFIGVFIIVVAFATNLKTNTPLYLGIVITVLALIWDLYFVYKKRNN